MSQFPTLRRGSDLLLSNSDLVIKDGDFSLVADLESIKQNFEIRARFFQGEWFQNSNLGVPYFQKILGAKTPQTILESLFRTVIETTPGIDVLQRVDVTLTPARELQISFVASTIAGELDYSNSFVI